MNIMEGHEHVENDSTFKGLKVNKGVVKTPPVNDDAVRRFLGKRRPVFTVEQYVDGILSGNITILSRAVTLVESSLPRHQEFARQIIAGCLPHSGKSIRLGITGVPGAGKSTFIEALGLHLISGGAKLAVLAIDPSSARSRGSILGDKTRMERLSAARDAYIRPSPAAGSLGGVARKTRETIIMCEAAGFDTIFIETVGVGQSETAVHSMVDFFLLLMLAGAGDELQGIKRGIMEMADGIVINKADGQNIDKAMLAQSQYTTALHMFPRSRSGWIPRVEMCSSLYFTGIDMVWNMVKDYINHCRQNGFLIANRLEQSKYWMHDTINQSLKDGFYQDQFVREKIIELEKMVQNNKISSFEAARVLLDLYFNR